METSNLSIRVDEKDKKSFDDTVYEKLQEAELEMDHTSKRYTKEEILESMNKVIDKYACIE